jgi:hypothetical protein
MPGPVAFNVTFPDPQIAVSEVTGSVIDSTIMLTIFELSGSQLKPLNQIPGLFHLPNSFHQNFAIEWFLYDLLK